MSKSWASVVGASKPVAIIPKNEPALMKRVDIPQPSKPTTTTGSGRCILFTSQICCTEHQFCQSICAKLPANTKGSAAFTIRGYTFTRELANLSIQSIIFDAWSHFIEQFDQQTLYSMQRESNPPLIANLNDWNWIMGVIQMPTHNDKRTSAPLLTSQFLTALQPNTHVTLMPMFCVP